MARQPSSRPTQRGFDQDLVLARWALRPFGAVSIAALGGRLRDPPDARRETDGATWFMGDLLAGTLDQNLLPETALRRHDLAVAEHWAGITARRGNPAPKYFQYLAMLFTERYLEDFFARPDALLASVNTELSELQQQGGGAALAPYALADLNKLAFWAATGSGKTLLLHAAIRQYCHHHKAAQKRGPDRIFLLTPNEALSRQHLAELRLSGLTGALFDGGAPLDRGGIDILDIHKLHDTASEGRFAVSAFEGKNLVLVDEGHRGAGSELGVWMRHRAALARRGFSIEYSATFGQSVGARGAKPALREAYAKAIIVDYSYRHFYHDGYGKDWRVLNLAADGYARHGEVYFTACLLSFYQQLLLWEEHRTAIADFAIEKPLWVFVGNKVADEDSDMLTVVRHLAGFLNQRARAQDWIGRLVSGETLLLDAAGADIFANRFVPLMGRAAATIYADILGRLFNAAAVQRLVLVNLRATKGELALRVGTAPAFGVINVGDDAGLFRAAGGDPAFDTLPDPFAPGLFDTINTPDSRVNLLIGSRKFTEGWSSWRVSTMGLLNMGRGEGSQIIQLFGRGVRLRGRNMSLKRTQSDADRPRGAFLEVLERLTIFGVRADYMARFQELLGAEGVSSPEAVLELDFPTHPALPKAALKTLRLRPDHAGNAPEGFLHAERLIAFEMPPGLAGRVRPPHATLDLYPRLAALETGSTITNAAGRHPRLFYPDLLRLVDWDAVTLALRASKSLGGITNLLFERDRLREFCKDDHWYSLFCPESELALTSWDDIERQQSHLIALLIAYAKAFHTRLREAYEARHYDLIDVTEQDGSWVESYQITFDGSDAGAIYRARLMELQEYVAAGALDRIVGWQAGWTRVVAIFAPHLYQPLLGLNSEGLRLPLTIRPIAFGAPSELAFVRALKVFVDSPAGQQALAGRNLYLLRNAGNRNRGLGFAQAGAFYPDYLIWLTRECDGRQWLSFVDPKGLRGVSLDDPKLGLPNVLADIAKTLGHTAPTLSAFVLSPTPATDLVGGTRGDYEERGVVFTQSRDYLATMFARIGD